MFSRLTDQLQAIVFISSQADHSLYIYHQGSTLIYLLIYVDEIILAGADMQSTNRVISLLQNKFVVKDLGDLTFFLGIEAIRDNNGLHLSQRRYILDLLTRSQMDKAKPCLTPISTSQLLSKSDSKPFADPHLYRSIVGGLQYLSFTRPYVAFAIHKVSKYMHNPLEPHWIAVKRILRYLKSTISHALCHNLIFYPFILIIIYWKNEKKWKNDDEKQVKNKMKNEIKFGLKTIWLEV